MEKLTIKITLNPKNYFDAQLIVRLSGEKNMAGALKGLAYERLTIDRLAVQAQPTRQMIPFNPLQASSSETTEAAPTIDPEEKERCQRREQLEREVDGKLDHMLEKF